jgi:biotin carboxyl carrier protein
MMDSESSITIDSPIDVNVWKVLVEPGDLLEEGEGGGDFGGYEGRE